MNLIKINHSKIEIKSDSFLSGIAINDIVIAIDNKKNVKLVCSVDSIIKNEVEQYDFEGNLIENEPCGTIECSIVGSIINGRFKRSVEKYPTTNVEIKKISNEEFNEILKSENSDLIKIGKYSNYDNPAYIMGNKFFQRHSAILGNTGSGKSVTVTSLIEKLSKLKSANIIVFDVHGEYKDLSFVKTIKIGNTGMPFPVWLLPFRDFYSGMLKVKEESAIIQIAALRSAFYDARGSSEASENTPISYDLIDIRDKLISKNCEEISTGEFYKTGDRAGLEKTVKGELNGKLFNIINLIQDKILDSRYTFMTEYKPQKYLFKLLEMIFDNFEKKIKVIDFSDIPHDIMPTIIAAVTKLIYDVQCRQNNSEILPLQIICDEAHIYIPNDSITIGASQKRLLEIFETIAKEGRKFGLSLTIVSQRPSDINRTILAQCANYICLKISNDIDKQYIKSILPNGNKSAIDELNLFSPGDCIIIGDCADIIQKIKIELPKELPHSDTLNTFDIWQKKENNNILNYIGELKKEND